jgi:type II secretory pathway component PulM
LLIRAEGHYGMNESTTRLESAETHVQEAQAVLATVERALEAAEKAQAAAARAATLLRTANVVVLVSAALVGIAILTTRRRHQS